MTTGTEKPAKTTYPPFARKKYLQLHVAGFFEELECLVLPYFQFQLRAVLASPVSSAVFIRNDLWLLRDWG